MIQQGAPAGTAPIEEDRAILPASPTAGPDDVLGDPHRIAAARRLLAEAPGPLVVDRVCGLAARLLGAALAVATLVTDEDVAIGGSGPLLAAGGPDPRIAALGARVVGVAAPAVVPDAAHDPELGALPAGPGHAVAHLGVPLVAASGHVVGVLAVADPVPRAWTDDDVALLEQLAGSVVAELELAAARSAIGVSLDRLAVAAEAAAVGIWEQDLRSGAVFLDERCAALFGLAGPAEFPSPRRLLAERVHPDDLAAVTGALRSALSRRGEFAVEARAVRPDGTVLWTVSRGRVVSDARGRAVRVLGALLDVSTAREEADRRLSAVQRAAAVSAVAADVARATAVTDLAEIALRGAQVLGAHSIALAVTDPEDGRLRAHLTRTLVDTVASAADVHLPAAGVEIADDDALPTQWVARHGERLLFPDPASAQARFPQMAQVSEVLGVRALAALPLRVEGRLLGSFVVVWRDDHAFPDGDVELLEALTAQIALSLSRQQADAARARAVAEMAAANRRLQLLAEAGRTLAGTHDIGQQLERLARLVVPPLGDWCWIVATDGTGRLHEVASAHRDPARDEQVRAYVRMMVASVTEDAAPRVVFRTGRPLVIPELQPERIARSLADPQAREALLALAPASVAAVPLTARGRTLGVLCLLTDAGRGPHTAAEVETAIEVGRRAGTALDQARLYAAQRELADALQHGMLTDPVQPPCCAIAVRYRPAAAGAEIGGDWYDAFGTPGGATVLAIGDVVGHDSRAAADMGQVRGLLRGISYSTGAPPAEVLTRLDRAVAGLALDTMATALVARVEPAGPGTPPGGARLRWSSAGHPPPVAVDPDGGVRLLEAVPADLLLGVDPDARRADRVVDLPAGATLLLYTDGLVERRDRDLDAGTTALVALLGELAGLPLEELCDRVLERLFLADAADDVALLAVRLRPGGGGAVAGAGGAVAGQAGVTS